MSFALFVLIGSASAAHAQTGTRCDTARGLMASERAKLVPGASRTVLEEASQNLRRATDLCPGLGDAYYFLSLISLELKDAPRAANWRQKAEFNQSQALRSGEPLFAADVGAHTERAPSLPAPPLAAVKVSPYVRQKLALVVGISQFRDPQINALKFTTRDAEAMANALEKDAGFDYVKRLFDAEATQHNVKTEIERLARMATPDDLVVLYVASHGSPENLDTAGVNYVVTYDTEVDNLYATAVSMDDLLEALTSRIKAERLVAFLDTCYSGGTFRELPTGWASSSRSLNRQSGVAVSRIQERLAEGSRALVVDDGSAAAGRVKQGVGRAIITSSTQAQRSWEDDRIKHGYFTYFLLEALRKPGPVSITDLFEYLRTRVPEAVQKDKNQMQTPGIARSRERVDVYLKDRVP